MAAKADAALARCRDALQAALLDKAALLHSDALRERLAQGRRVPFIAGLLATATPEAMAEYLVQRLGGEAVEEPDPADLLRRYLQKLRVRKLRLADFAQRAHCRAGRRGWRRRRIPSLLARCPRCRPGRIAGG